MKHPRCWQRARPRERGREREREKEGRGEGEQGQMVRSLQSSESRCARGNFCDAVPRPPATLSSLVGLPLPLRAGRSPPARALFLLRRMRPPSRACGGVRGG